MYDPFCKCSHSKASHDHENLHAPGYCVQCPCEKYEREYERGRPEVKFVHPTYGTLDQLLAEIRGDIEQGWEIRIGQKGALDWFSAKYSAARSGSGT